MDVFFCVKTRNYAGEHVFKTWGFLVENGRFFHENSKKRNKIPQE